jgi:hypothetical protein
MGQAQGARESAENTGNNSSGDANGKDGAAAATAWVEEGAVAAAWAPDEGVAADGALVAGVAGGAVDAALAAEVEDGALVDEVEDGVVDAALAAWAAGAA